MISSRKSIHFVLYCVLYWLFTDGRKRKDKRFLCCSYFFQCFLFAWYKQVAYLQHIDYTCADNNYLVESYYMLIKICVCAWPRRESFILRAYKVDNHWRSNSSWINIIIQRQVMASSQSPAAPQTLNTQSSRTLLPSWRTRGSDKLFWYSKHQARP